MQSRAERGLTYISLIAVLVAWLVVGLGAFTRLMDAGLGCPDWPGCYGHLRVPDPSVVACVVSSKAWTEMLHRYAAGTLALLTFGVAALSVRVAVRRGIDYLLIALALLLVVVFQALLGMWTVTLKLWPVVVSAHLLGGMLLLGLLWFVQMKSRWDPTLIEHRSAKIAGFGVLLVFLQLALGAWTSTNYAAVGCATFPVCGASFDVGQAFSIFSPMGRNYEGGVLPLAVRQTIHMVHRIGAVFVLSYIFGLWLAFRRAHFYLLRRSVHIVLCLAVVQVFLGVATAFWDRPMATALLHNLTAGLVWCATVSVYYFATHRLRS